MSRTKGDTLRTTTLSYLATLDVTNPPSPTEIEKTLLNLVETAFDVECANKKEKGRRWVIPQTLSHSQVADIIATLYPVCRLSYAGFDSDPSYDLLAIYQADGVNKGTYVTDEGTFRAIAKLYNYQMSSKEFIEVMTDLKDKVPRRIRCADPDLIAVNNGIFNYRTKTLQEFSPEYIFIAKSHVNYNPHAKNVTLRHPRDTEDWDVESWMASLSDDDGVVDLLWEMLGAIIRPYVKWDKSAWMYSERGNNGKGTLCELMRNLCGPGSYASISIADFSKNFMLEPLVRASSIIVDENDVGEYIDKAAALKSIITNDTIQLDRKFKSPINLQFHGFMVQCINGLPKMRDKSDSVYRRQLFIPMRKCFTGKERKYIKSDYLHDKDVLEYVLFKVLNSNYYTLSEPEVCKELLAEYKEHNDPVRQFFAEFEHTFQWDLLPFPFLYELYKSWLSKNSPRGLIQGRTAFISDLIQVIETSDEWFCPGKNKSIKTTTRMDKHEPLIVNYGLTDWMNENYKGQDITKKCRPTLSASYRGLQRREKYVTLSNDDKTNVDEPTDVAEN